MPIATRTKRGASGTVVLAFDEATPLSSAFSITAVIQRPNTTGPTQATLEAAGWTLEGSRTNTASGIWVYRRRGNGSVNGITVDGTAAGTVITLLAAPTYLDDYLTFASAIGGTASVVTIPVTGVSAPEDDCLAWSFTQLSGTAGGTTPAGIQLANNGYSQLAGTSASSTTAYAEKALPTSGTSAANTATWTTTSRTGVHVVLVAQTTDHTPPPADEWFIWTSDRTLNHPADELGVKTP